MAQKPRLQPRMVDRDGLLGREDSIARSRFRRARSGRRTRSAGIGRSLYPLLGAVLLIPTIGAWTALARASRSLPGDWSVLGPLAAGIGAYALLHLAFRRPMTLYVFGHELTHAIAALVSGYRVKSLFVSEKGGEVRLSDTNVAVALAPYCLPIYTLFVLALYALVRRYADLSSPPLWVGFGLGLTLAFHGALTFHALRQGQPDLRAAGTLFSLIVIALANALALALALKALFPSDISFTALAGTWWSESRGLILAVGKGLAEAARWLERGLAR